RSLCPALGARALVAAVGLDQLPGRRRGLPILAMLVAQVVLNAVYLGRFLSRITAGHPSVATAAGLPVSVTLVAAGALLALALAMVARALWTLEDRPPATSRAGSGTRPPPG